MDKALLIAVLALLLTSLLTTSVALNSAGETRLPVLNVDTGLGYATIQEAVNADATLDGHTIRVDAGVYYENVVVDKSLSLIGENKFNTIIDGGASGSVIRIRANRVNVTGFTVRNSTFGCSGIYVDHSSGDNISQNIARNNYNGIYVYGSVDDTVADNDVLGNEYGIHLYGSGNNNVSGNDASNNMNGIHLDVSSNNTLTGNNVWSNAWNGIYLYGSGNNTLSGNSACSNYGRGVRLHYSSDNTLSGNVVSSNKYGIILYGSEKNILTGNNASFNNESGILLQGSGGNAFTCNVVSNNTDGIWLIDSGGNAVWGNNVFSNDEYGVRVWNSSRNIFFYNNFIKNLVRNVEQPSNSSILNLWDNGAEGNFWSDYDGADAGMSGVGDKPYIVDERAWMGVYSQDSYPLMGQFFQFSTVIENRSYTVIVVSNSTVSGFQYNRGPDNMTNTINLKVNGTEGMGFCRISIPHVLIKPPYNVTVDQAPPLFYDEVRTNGTYTWVYFTYVNSEHELVITPPTPPAPTLPVAVPIWFQWYFWGIFGLVLGEAVLASFAVRYRRRVAEQTKILRAYSPFVIAEALFKADIERRGLKIREFEKKYGVKIQPRSTLEDIIRSLETKEGRKKVET